MLRASAKEALYPDLYSSSGYQQCLYIDTKRLPRTGRAGFFSKSNAGYEINILECWLQTTGFPATQHPPESGDIARSFWRIFRENLCATRDSGSRHVTKVQTRQVFLSTIELIPHLPDSNGPDILGIFKVCGFNVKDKNAGFTTPFDSSSLGSEDKFGQI
jgi:hypothetical protein